MSNKITLEEFFHMEMAAIHCKTKRESDRLMRAFHIMGKKWKDGNSYINSTMDFWSDYGDKTCYSSTGGYTKLSAYEEKDYRIFEFEDVVLGDAPYQSLLEIIEKEKPT